MNVYRYEQNPLITPEDVKPYHDGFRVIGAFNAGVARCGDETILLLRVAEQPISSDPDVVRAPVLNPSSGQVEIRELNRNDERYDFSDPRVVRDVATNEGFAFLTSISYIRAARSKDGRRFTIDDAPLVYPSDPSECFGIEDPRCTRIGDRHYLYYSAVSTVGIGVNMVSTEDFASFERHGMIFCPDNKDVVLFPEKIGGKYYALHRPTTRSIGKPEIWIAESDNLNQWGRHRHLMGSRPGMWDSGRIGAGAVPVKTEYGWLELYHGADDRHRYCMGAVLLDLEDPSKILARSGRPVLEPEADYEKQGFFGDVVFSCGAILVDDVLKVYYGCADTSMAGAEIRLRDIMDNLIWK
jgi:predicted GH43/DUF377 family glycosyl hydrolase